MQPVGVGLEVVQRLRHDPAPEAVADDDDVVADQRTKQVLRRAGCIEDRVRTAFRDAIQILICRPVPFVIGHRDNETVREE